MEERLTSVLPGDERALILVGNPNVGKSTLFASLTGHYVTVSNYPGTTVEVSRGRVTQAGLQYTVLDTPGTNTLIPTSEAEQVTRDILLASPEARVLQVAEMKNVRRGVLLALELAELETPCVLDLNMSDEAASEGVVVDVGELSRRLGIDVAETVAVRQKGIRQLKEHIGSARVATVRCPYAPHIEAAAAAIEALLPHNQRGKRGIALMFLAGDETIVTWAHQRLDERTLRAIEDIRRDAAARSRESLRYQIIRDRLTYVDRLIATAVHRRQRTPSRLLDSLSHYSMHPVWGIPVLAGVLLAAYYLVGVLGAGILVDLLESRFFGSELARVEVAAVPPAVTEFSTAGGDGAPAAGSVVLKGRVARAGEGWSIFLSVQTRQGDGLRPAQGVVPYWYATDGSGSYGRLEPLAGTSAGYSATIPARILAHGDTGGRLLIRAWSGLLNRRVFNFFHARVPIPFVRDLMVGEYGVLTMALTYAIAIVLPIVGVFFIFFSFLEDSGYLPRLAIMVNVLFKKLGLNGTAVLPMVLGLGCDTMATMTTRIMQTRKERVIVTLLLALAVPCSAQLGVILAMLSWLSLAASVVWVMTILGVIFAVGYLAARVLPGRSSDFILEVCPLRVPRLRNILIKTAGRIEWYLREAVPLFVFGTLVLFALDRLDALDALERAIAPLVEGVLGLPRAATAALLLGFLRRDYGAAGLFAIFQPQIASGHLSPNTEVQIVVSMVTITLFVPCIANVFMMIKERGLKTAMAMVAFIFPFAFAVGALVNVAMRAAYGVG